ILAPVEHALRNAVIHGIEHPEVRAAQGKEEAGSIRIDLSQEGSELRIVVADDGAGLDLEKIRARALREGLFPASAAPSEAELADCIFQPGFTTADQLTQASGRGVGMDVVRRAVAALGGRVEVQNQPR